MMIHPEEVDSFEEDAWAHENCVATTRKRDGVFSDNAIRDTSAKPWPNDNRESALDTVSKINTTLTSLLGM